MLLVTTSNNGETGVLACDITELSLFNISIRFGCALWKFYLSSNVLSKMLKVPMYVLQNILFEISYFSFRDPVSCWEICHYYKRV